MFCYRLIVTLFSVPFLIAAAQLTWCGKHYQQGSPVVPPGGQFQFPDHSDVPLLDLQCSPAVKPYLTGEEASLIVDARITWSKIPRATPLPRHFDVHDHLSVSVSVDGGDPQVLGMVALNSTGTEFPLSTKSLTPRKQPFAVTCTATLSGSSHGDPQTFKAYTQLHYLSPPLRGSVTKQDFRTGALLVKKGSTWEPFFAMGFYTSFDNYLTNLSNVDAIKNRGLNIIHPVPTFGNLTAFNETLDRMEELGLWLMYDMRFTYRNLTSVMEQVNMIKDRPNLLLWYTGDEPDGTSDPLNATKVTYDFIYDLDGYHPVSLVLNCQDYFFPEYSLGADVLLQDTYPVDINATFSRVWGTPCTPDFGDCGCDNCLGSFEDISTRVDEFKQRLDVLGRSRSTAVWSVPQAFGQDTYWPRFPTGKEWLVMSVLGVNHGSLGILPWIDPTTPDITAASSALAAAVPQILPFLTTPHVKFTAIKQDGVDAAMWTLKSQTLLLAANPNTAQVSIVLEGAAGGTARQVLDGGGELKVQDGKAVLTLQGTGTAGWIFEGSENAQDTMTLQ